MIRHARLSDLQQIRYLAQTQFAPYAQRLRGPREPLSADFREMVEAEHISVYVIENAVRGFVCYWIDGPDVHVEALALAARARRRGAGRMLLDHVDRQGLRAHCRRMIFHSNAQNFENMAYFRGKGLQETDRRNHNGYERVVMERYLR